MLYDVLWFREANKQEAYGLVKRLPEAEIAQRELWPCHGLRFWFAVPIPDKYGKLTNQDGICVQPNLYGSEYLGAGLIENREDGKYLKLARFCEFTVLENGIVGGTWVNGLLGTPEFLAEAAKSKENSDSALASVQDLRRKLIVEKMEEAAPLILRWSKNVAILAGAPNADDLEPEDAQMLYEDLNIGQKGLLPLKEWLAKHGYFVAAAKPELSADPLDEAKHAYGQLVLPDKKILTDKSGRKIRDLS